MNDEYKMKIKFLTLIEGCFDNEPMIKGIDSYRLGICKMELIDNVFHVYLRRPGLLIGKKGETIIKLKELLEVPVYIHEVDLMKESEK